MNPLDDPKAAPRQPQPTQPLTKLDTHSLFDGRREVLIVHNGEEYRLRITRQEKLILTK